METERGRHIEQRIGENMTASNVASPWSYVNNTYNIFFRKD
jgi:hypothetical protein